MVTPVRLILGRVYNSGRLAPFGERPKLLSDDPIYFSGAQHQAHTATAAYSSRTHI